MNESHTWITRQESSADVPAIRAIVVAAFPTPAEADLVEALRADPEAWIDGLSIVAADEGGTPVGHALLTRGHIGEVPALTLAPVSVLPERQRSGAGSAAVRAALRAAAVLGERYVTVLGDPAYYPRFGFTRAADHGIGVTVEVPVEALMALALHADDPLPSGTIRYPAPFGI